MHVPFVAPRTCAGMRLKRLSFLEEDGNRFGAAMPVVAVDRDTGSSTPRCGKLRSTPLGKLDPVIRLSEGNSLASLREVAQESQISHRLRWPRTTNTRAAAPLLSQGQEGLTK
jgi:hypothetical protein